VKSTSRDRALARHLEAVAGSLLRHQEVRDAEEPALETALEPSHGALADGETADGEGLGIRSVAENDGAVPNHRRQLGEEEARVSTPPPPGVDHLRFPESERAVAQVRVERGPGHSRGVTGRRLRRRGEGSVSRPEGEPQRRLEADEALAGGGEGHALHVDQPVREGDAPEEPLDLAVGAEGRQIVGDLAVGPGLDRGPRLDLHLPELRVLGEVADVDDVGGRRRPVGQDAAQRLQPAVEEQALVREGAHGLGEEEGAEKETEHGES
jgi:hypothetical protein